MSGKERRSAGRPKFGPDLQKKLLYRRDSAHAVPPQLGSMSSSPMISSTVKDFLQSFYEAVSWEREYEITRIVEHQWQEFSSDHFKDEPWPAPEVVAPLAKNGMHPSIAGAG